MKAFPDPTGAIRDVGITCALVVHLQVAVSAVAEEFRAAGSEVGEPGDELLGRRGAGLFEVDCGHVRSFLSWYCNIHSSFGSQLPLRTRDNPGLRSRASDQDCPGCITGATS